MVTELKVEDGKVTGIVTELGEFYGAKAVILCTGTYLKVKSSSAISTTLAVQMVNV